jgi:hypothetical protein
MLMDTEATPQIQTPPTQPTINVKRRQSDVPKPSMTVKRMWHAACFQPRDRKGSGRKWRRLPGQWMPLKAFVKSVSGGPATAWAANKRGAANASRSDANIARAAAEKAASRASRGK